MIRGISNFLLTGLLAVSVNAVELPSPVSYDLHMQLFPSDERLEAVCEVTLANLSLQPISKIPALLYRLLEVTAVLDQSGRPMPYEQRITRMADNRACQVNALMITLPHPLMRGDSVQLQIAYRGYIYGYPEVMQYTRDRVSEDYTLIRDDVFAYPIICDTSWESLRQTFGSFYQYAATVKVPRGFVVASGGALVGIDTTADSVTYVYRNKVPVSRIDIAAARFSMLSDSGSRLSAFYLPGDSAGARHVMQAMREVVPYYIERFDPAPGYAGFTVIEIPEGWGSQAGTFYILQAAAAFRDSSRISEVYHEVGHSWNAKVNPLVQRCRFFDEAFASYFESMSLGHFKGDSAFEADMEANRRSFIRRTEKDSSGRLTPIAQYGNYDLGRYSYTKGAWSLYVLNRIIGDESFNKLIHSMVTNYADKAIDFQSFKELAESISPHKLDKFFDEWIFGTISSKLMLDNTSIDSIVQRYR